LTLKLANQQPTHTANPSGKCFKLRPFATTTKDNTMCGIVGAVAQRNITPISD